MKVFLRLFLLVFFFSFASHQSLLFSEEQTDSGVKAELIVEDSSYLPGNPITVAIRLEMDPSWHIYWENPGEAGFPVMVEWELPEGFVVEGLKWPYPHRIEENGILTFGFKEQAVLLATIVPSQDVSYENVEIKAKVSWLACSHDACVPGDATVKVSLPLAKQAPEKNLSFVSVFQEAKEKLPEEGQVIAKLCEKDTVKLVIPKEKTSNISKVEFFPRKAEWNDSFNFSKAIPLNQTQDAWVASLPMQKVHPEKVDGVLVVYDHQGRAKAYEVFPKCQLNASVLAAADGERLQLPPLGEHVHAEDNLQEEVTDPFAFKGGVLWAIVLAFIGGIILNLMPCVLPVMSFKVLSFVKMKGQSRATTIKHGLFFSLGVLVSFWVIAIAMIVLASYGRSVGWGFQLQEPLFVAIMTTILVVFGLSLFGVFEFGTSIASYAGQVERSAASDAEGVTGSFLSGVLATAVATPCTGPFLGSAIGFAATLAPIYSLMIFTSLGMGMALPYLLLAAFPKLLAVFPKPGAWMVTFKQLMGFFMMATSLWLLWVFAAQTSAEALIQLIGALLVISFGFWIYGIWGSPAKKKSVRQVAYVLLALFFLLGSYIAYKATDTDLYATEMTTKQEDGWEVYSRERLEELRQQGIPVFVDFTAKWCLICQTNHLVLMTSDVEKKLDEHGVVKMKADWTKRDELITKELRKYGRNGVPLYLIYGKDPNKPPQVLPQVLTKEAILEALEKI